MTEHPHHLGPRIITALDFQDLNTCIAFAKKLDPQICRVKVGKELFTRCGPAVVEQLQKLGFDVFLDLKFHDIPATVAGALRAAAQLGVWMVNVHASGGPRMLDAAVGAVTSAHHQPLVIAVTVLTSMSPAELRECGVARTLGDQVLYLARMARDQGLDGVVCSAQEAVMLKAELGTRFLLVTPGIRPAGTAQDDQSRIMTPEQAVAAGSDYLVIGRPITGAADPVAACRVIARSIDSRAADQ